MTKQASILDIAHINQVVRNRAATFGVNVTFDPAAYTAYTDGTNIVLPAVPHPIPMEELDKIYGYVIHECGHHWRPEAFDILRRAKPSVGLAGLFNITEDNGMERYVASQSRGDAKALGVMNAILVNQFASKTEEIREKEGLSEMEVAPLAALWIGQLARLEWDDWSASAIGIYVKDINPTAGKLVTDLIGEGWVTRFQETETPEDTWDLACDLYKRLYPDCDSEALEEVRSAGKNGDEAGDTEHEHNGGECGTLPKGEDGVRTVEGAGECDSIGTEREKKLSPSESGIISWRDASFSDHDKVGKPSYSKDPDGPTGGYGIDWTGWKGTNSALFAPPSEVSVLDMRSDTYQPQVSGQHSPKKLMSDTSDIKSLGNQIRRYLQATLKTKVRSEQLHGKLDKRGVIRLLLPPIEKGEWNKKVFYDLQYKVGMDTCVLVLTDWSGSMNGERMQKAADASGRIVAIMDRVLKIPVQLAAFTTRTSTCDIGLIKKFNERSIAPIEIATRFSKFVKFSSGNNDADAVLWAYREILKRKEPRKILIVISDGTPTDCYNDSGWCVSRAHTNLVKVAKTIDSDPRVDLFGLGIQTRCVKNYYSNNRVVNETGEISPALFNIIKDGYNAKRRS